MPTYMYGRHPVLELLAARPEAIIRLYLSHGDAALEAAAGTAQLTIEWLDKGRLARLVGADAVHQGVVAQIKPFAYCPLDALQAPADTPALLVCLDQVQDPHNLGALVRSALALGAHGVIIGQDRSAEITPTAIKAAAGATAHLPIARVVNISRALGALKERGLWAVGAAGEGPTPLGKVDFTLPTVLVIGHEGRGLRPLVARACDVLTHISIATIGSLNASVAGAICLYEAQRQRADASFQHRP